VVAGGHTPDLRLLKSGLQHGRNDDRDDVTRSRVVEVMQLATDGCHDHTSLIPTSVQLVAGPSQLHATSPANLNGEEGE